MTTEGERLPYPGLRSFTREETDLFFGREGCVDDMVDRLAATRFLVGMKPRPRPPADRVRLATGGSAAADEEPEPVPVDIVGDEALFGPTAFLNGVLSGVAAMPLGVVFKQLFHQVHGNLLSFVCHLPAGVPRAPTAWDYGRQATWRLAVAAPTTPLRLLDAADDIARLSFSRVGDGWREGIFRVVPSTASGEPAIHLELPVNVGGISPEEMILPVATLRPR